MDYQKFYAEVVEWIDEANQMAVKHGMHSNIFWDWVMSSTATISEKYENNKLVLNQMVMLFHWLEDFYAEAIRK